MFQLGRTGENHFITRVYAVSNVKYFGFLFANLTLSSLFKNDLETMIWKCSLNEDILSRFSSKDTFDLESSPEGYSNTSLIHCQSKRTILLKYLFENFELTLA